MHFPVVASITLFLALSGLAAPVYPDFYARSLFGGKKVSSAAAAPIAKKPPIVAPKPPVAPVKPPVVATEPKPLEPAVPSTSGGFHIPSLFGGKNITSAAVAEFTPVSESEPAAVTSAAVKTTTSASPMVTTAASASAASIPLASAMADNLCPADFDFEC
ncbi:hypothetical protein B0H11DRAFT_2254915 [Mycena galericulata]|nr:hypothetical protein B0H11DRAFT_2254915 [Mycena galericulata]